MTISRCTHLRINGARCAMPAAHGRELCFEHESRYLRLRARPSLPSTFATAPLVSFVYPEDHFAILENIHAISRALAQSEINDRTASIMDRLMNTALRTLRQAQKLEKSVTSDEMIRHFRIDSNGNPRADEPASKPEPQSAIGTAETAILPALSAEAEQPLEPESHKPGSQKPSRELRRITNSQNLSALLSTVAQSGKLETLLSNTYIFRNGKLIVAPIRELDSHADPSRRASAYIFLSNMR